MKKKGKRIVFIGLLAIIVTAFFAIFAYVRNINIYPGFTVQICSTDTTAVNGIKLTGITVFGREKTMDLINGIHYNENWTFKKIKIEKKPGFSISEPIEIAFFDISTHRLFTKAIIANNDNSVVLKSIGQNNALGSKFKQFTTIIGLNRVLNKLSVLSEFSWLAIMRMIVFILVITIIVYYLAFQKKYPWKNSIVNLTSIRYLVYGMIVVSGVVLRFSNPATTILGYDYSGFLLPVYKHFEFGTFDHYEWSYLYPWFIISISSIFKNIDCISVVQHLLSAGSVIAFLIFVELHMLKNLTNRFLKLIFTIVLFVFVDVLFTNFELIVFEKHLHHEGLLIPSMLLITGLVFSYFNNLFKRRLLIFSITVFFLFFVSLLQYRFTVGLFAVALLMLFIECRFRWKKSGAKMVYPVLIFIVFYCVVYLPEKYLINKYDRVNPAFPYAEFFYSNARAVESAVNKGIVVDKKYDSHELQNIVADVLHSGGKKNNLLGYDFDYFKYTRSKPSLKMYILKSNGLVDDSVKLETFGDWAKFYFIDFKDPENKAIRNNYIRFCQIHNQYFKDWAWVLLKNCPKEVAAKTLKQLGFIFSPRAVYAECATDFDAVNPTQQYPFQQKYFNLLSRLNYKQGRAIHIHFPDSGIKYKILTNYFVYFFMMGLILYSIYLFFRRRPSLSLFSLVLIFLCTVITVSILQTFDTNRYVITLLPLAITAILLFTFDVVTKIDNKLNREYNPNESDKAKL
ncbi:MAG TPA: hypothetical protein PLZ52_01485 [Bacteroidales bacterium]|nr:hypothetical protein [Bacteroidales bacterium]HQL69757.1 hypothetical protein [Bacteroidales bacterium]